MLFLRIEFIKLIFFQKSFSNLENENINLKESHNKELNQINAKIDSMIKSKNDECEHFISKVNNSKSMM